MIDLPHVASRAFGTPLMIARAKLERILGVLGPRLAGNALSPIEPEADPPPRTSITVERIAVVSVIGTLVSRSGYLDAASGLSSYAEIGEAIAAAMADPTVRGVVLDVDSAGGEVGGLFDLVEQIGAIKAASAKPLWAVANESALSAAYAIASAADRVYVTRTGEIGSVGVVAVHIDESGADAKAGLSWTFVFAGERKVDGNAHEPLSERARAAIQADVDRLYAELCALVAANRGLTPETVRGTQAAVYRGELAIRAGLADRVGTLDLAIAEMAAELDRSASPFAPDQRPKLQEEPFHGDQGDRSNATHDGGTAAAVANERARQRTPTRRRLPRRPQRRRRRPRLRPSLLRQNSDAAPTEKLRAEFAEIAAIAAQALRLGVAVDAADAMSQGHLARRAAPLRARCARRPRRGDQRHRRGAIHAHCRRQPDRAPRQGARRGGSRVIT